MEDQDELKQLENRTINVRKLQRVAGKEYNVISKQRALDSDYVN